VVLRGACWWEQGKELLDRFDEVVRDGFHREIDRIEVDFAVEAAAQVGPWIDHRNQFTTAGALESQLPSP